MHLRRMAEIAQDAQNNVPRNSLTPASATILSSYTEALDTVRLHDSGYIDGYLPTFICTALGPPLHVVPGHCRILAEAERSSNTLRCRNMYRCTSKIVISKVYLVSILLFEEWLERKLQNPIAAKSCRMRPLSRSERGVVAAVWLSQQACPAYSATGRYAIGRHLWSHVIEQRLLYINRASALHQFIQSRLLANPNHDQTIRCNSSILRTRQRCQQQCPKRLLESNDESECTCGEIGQRSAARKILVEERSDPRMNEE